jgi:aspartate/tyrosine/aromatic aminotransferase
METSFMILKYIIRTTYMRLQKDGVKVNARVLTKEMLNDIEHIMNDSGNE